MNGFVCKAANTVLNDMELFIVCPRCEQSFESTSTQMVQCAGRVECPSCNHMFDGYAHYRFDVLGADQSINQDISKDEKQPSEQMERSKTFGTYNTNHSAVARSPLTQVGSEKIIRETNDANLYEAVFAPLPKTKSIWRYINIVLCVIFVAMIITSFNKQILAGIPKSTDWMHQVCGRIDCEIKSKRRINDLRLVGADLVMRSDVGDGTYQFRATIQNVGIEQLELPAIELKLTDTQGRIITSRVIYPMDYVEGPAQSELGTKMEYQLNLLIRVEGTPPSTFDSYLFYPPEIKA